MSEKTGFDIEEARSGRMHRLLLVVLPMMALAFLAVLTGNNSTASAEAQYAQYFDTTKVIRNDATGGDCGSIGIWNAESLTCTLTDDLYFTNSQSNVRKSWLTIVDDNITLDGAGHFLGMTGWGIPIELNGYQNITIKRLIINNPTPGISLSASGTPNSKFLNNDFAGDIFIRQSPGASLDNNHVGGHAQISYSDSFSVTKNAVVAITVSHSSNCTITENNGGSLSFVGNNSQITKNYFTGLGLNSADNNLIAENTVVANDYWSALSNNSDSENNTIINNNFIINNNKNPLSGGWRPNKFNEEKPLGGNYWSNYDSPEEGCQDLDGDGFCDSPLMLESGGWKRTDALPWTIQNGWLDKTPPTISSVEPNGTLNSNSAIVMALFSDESGINIPASKITLDDLLLDNCTATQSQIDCQLNNIRLGSHAIGGRIFDKAGQSTQIAGSFSTIHAAEDPLAPVIESVAPPENAVLNMASPQTGMRYRSTDGEITAASLSIDGTDCAGSAWNQDEINCTAAALAEGAHQVHGQVAQGEHQNTYDWSFLVDTIAPSINIVNPSGWISGNDATINATYSDSGSGIDMQSFVIKIDNVEQAGYESSASSANYQVVDIADGVHAMEASIEDNAGNVKVASGSFSVDTTKPAIFNTKPTGTANYQYEISADFSDAGSGVDAAKTILRLNGVDITSQASKNANHISYTASGDGVKNVRLEVVDNLGNRQIAEWSFSSPSPGYFTWYDNIYGRTWVMMASPVDSAGNLFDIYLGTQLMNPEQHYGVAPGKSAPQIYGGKMGGPVKVVPYSAEPALISERSLFGNSFEEIWATPFESLDSHYYWPWYDQATPGMQNWVLVANPRESGDAVEAEVRLHIPAEYGGDKVVTKVISPGESWAPSFPGYAAGPVEVRAWKAYSNRWDQANARKVIASQRVLWNGAFNEMPGIPASKLSNAYVWTWYDNNSPQATDDILIGNPNGQQTFIVVVLGETVVYAGYVPPNDFLPLRAKKGSAAGMGGPLVIFSCSNEQCDGPGADIYATQRITWGPSFGEIAGTPFEDITGSTHWTWYDQLSPGVVNWVLASNITNSDIYVEFKIGGKLVKEQVIAPGSSYTPTFPNYMDGPVEIKAWKSELEWLPSGAQRQKKATPYPVFASQRVLWNGYFNEIVGKGL